MLRQTLIAVALCAAPLVGQCFQIPDSFHTGSNVIPFGNVTLSNTWKNQKYQSLILSSRLKKGNICELAFSPNNTAVRHFDTIRIRWATSRGRARRWAEPPSQPT